MSWHLRKKRRSRTKATRGTLRKRGNVGESRNFAKQKIKSESSIARRSGEPRKKKEREKGRNKEEKMIKVGKKEERKGGIWEGRGSRYDWHLGNCLVRTESSRRTSNSTSFLLLAICAAHS